MEKGVPTRVNFFGTKLAKELTAGNRIVVTNYEQLHRFDWKDFSGCVCDESSILKSFDGARRSETDETQGFINWSKAGMSPKAIASTLNNSGVPTRHGINKRWHAGTVSKILRRETEKASA